MKMKIEKINFRNFSKFRKYLKYFAAVMSIFAFCGPLSAQDERMLSAGALIKKLSLDIRGTLPTRAEVNTVLGGKKNPNDFVDSFLESPEFLEQVRVYHRDKFWPNFDSPERIHYFDYLQEKEENAETIYYHPYTDGAEGCKVTDTTTVFPYWDVSQEVKVCQKTLGLFTSLNQIGTQKPSPDKKKNYRFDCNRNWDIRYCGCGKNLEHCVPYKRVLAQLKDLGDEGPRMASEIVKLNRPYTEMLTSQWSMRSGALSHLYMEKHSTNSVFVVDLYNRPWRAVGRSEVNSGHLTTAGFLRRFGTSKDWASKSLDDYVYCSSLVSGSTNTIFGDRSQYGISLSDVSKFHQNWMWKSEDKNSVQIPARYGFVSQSTYDDNSVFGGEGGKGVPAFAAILSESAQFRQCTVVNLFQYLIGRDPDETTENAELIKLADYFKQSGYNFKVLVKSIVMSKAYQRLP